MALPPTYVSRLMDPSDVDMVDISIDASQTSLLSETHSDFNNDHPPPNDNAVMYSASIDDDSRSIVSSTDSGLSETSSHLSFSSDFAAERDKPDNAVPPKTAISPFEQLSNELLQTIAAQLDNDRDLHRFTLTCRTFARATNPKNSVIWRIRFLSRYDYPLINSPYDFCIAYKLRRFVLRKFVDFSNGSDKRIQIQLEVMRDMVLESYHNPTPHLPVPTSSRNLAACASPDHSPWMVTFLSSPFCDHGRKAYGRPHDLFDALQLIFTHLIISPSSRMAHAVNSSRDNFDLVKVYNWNQPFETLYVQLPTSPAKPPDIEILRQAAQNSLFPNLKSRIVQWRKEQPKPRYELKLNTLLHIRNFWHRHLIDDSNGFFSDDIGERTYAAMARGLAQRHCSPRQWETALPQDSASTQCHQTIKGMWYGHYSCVHPWPKTRRDLDERQSCAEGWDQVDPLTLDFATSTNNKTDCFWPPIFRNIPCFSKMTPICRDNNTDEESVFIRGIAPFLDMSATNNSRAKISPIDTTLKLPKYHPFLSLRVRGVIHSIAPQVEIPGWRRLVMVLYKPSTRYLLQVLEHYEQDYGNAFGTSLTTMLQATQSQQQQQSNHITTSGSTSPTSSTPSTTTTTSNSTTTTTTTTTTSYDPTALETHLRSILTSKLLACSASASASTTTNTSSQSRASSGSASVTTTKESIALLEESFSASEYLEWVDIEYAYAYEGAVLPGGQIMLGRWWRVNGEVGTGEGREVDCFGEDVGFPLSSSSSTTNNATTTATTTITMDSDEIGDGSADVGGGGSASASVSFGPGSGSGEGEGGGSEKEGSTDGSSPSSSSSSTAAAQAVGTGGTTTRQNLHHYQALERGPFIFWAAATTPATSIVS